MNVKIHLPFEQRFPFKTVTPLHTHRLMSVRGGGGGGGGREWLLQSLVGGIMSF